MTSHRGAWLAVALTSAAAIFLLGVQVLHPFPFLNDAVLHYGLCRSLESAPREGQQLLDPWIGQWTLGFPVFHYYQIFPHLFVVALSKVSAGLLPLLTAFRLVEVLAAGLLPISMFVAARHLGFPSLAAAACGVLSLAPRTNYLHGLELESSTWQGLGQFTQAFGALFLPIALARTWTALRGTSSVGMAALFVTLTTVSHLALGAMALLAGGLFTVASFREFPKRILRLLLLAALSLAGSAFILVPLSRDFAYYNVSALVPSWKYDSFGHEIILRWLVTGELFDFQRLPLMTILIALGFATAAVRARKFANHRALLVLFLGALALYFGRPTWGRALDLLPLGQGFHFSRALALVQVAACLLAGVGVGHVLAWGWGTTGTSRMRRIFVAALVALGAAPLLADRGSYLLHNAKLVRDSDAMYEIERAPLEAAVAEAIGNRTGRVYAGLGGAGGPAWGGAFMVGWVPVYDWPPLRGADTFGYLHHQYSLNSDLFDRFDERNALSYRVFGIQTILAPEGVLFPAAIEETSRHGRFRVLTVRDPRARLLDLVDAPFAVHVSKTRLPRVQAKWLSSDLPGRGVYPEVQLAELGPPRDGATVVEGEVVRFPSVPALDAPGEIGEITRNGADFSVKAQATRPSVVVLKMTYHPAWKATVDGRPAATRHLLPSYVGVPIGPGQHTVVLRYDPGPEKWFLAAGGFAFLSLGIWGTRRSGRSKKQDDLIDGSFS